MGKVSNLPDEHMGGRSVLVSKTRPNCAQNATLGPTAFHWQIDLASEKGKWASPLMGWTSTADPYASTGIRSMRFSSAKKAAAYCDKMGWDYDVLGVDEDGEGEFRQVLCNYVAVQLHLLYTRLIIKF